jgi:hypothetical protein
MLARFANGDPPALLLLGRLHALVLGIERIALLAFGMWRIAVGQGLGCPRCQQERGQCRQNDRSHLEGLRFRVEGDLGLGVPHFAAIPLHARPSAVAAKQWPHALALGRRRLRKA